MTACWSVECSQYKQQAPFFQSLMYRKSFDIFCVTATWLSSHTYDGQILPAGYTIYRQDRDGRGGGILLAVSDRIVSSRVHVSTTCELLVVSQVLHPATLVCCVYTVADSGGGPWVPSPPPFLASYV